MSEIQITFQDLILGGATTKLIIFNGQLDETNVDHEAKQIYQIISEMPVPHLLLDFSGLEYMNSKSIGYLTDWFTQISAKSGTLFIVGPKPNILDILKVVGITQIITVYPTLEEAKAASGGESADAVAAPVTPAAPAAVAPVAPAPAPAPAPVEPTPVAATPVAPAPQAEAATPDTPAQV